jgi:hypothetical protein
MNRQQRRAAKRRQRNIGARSDQPGAPELECEIEFTGTECFFVIDGQRVAKRENRHWIPLVPGFEMVDNLYGGDIDALDKCQGGAQ